jgi:NDP-sugar pyrophosphorylase family protein
MQIIIPMSGVGKRFMEAGYSDPKPLIEVDGYPMIKHVIDLFPLESNFTFICNDKYLKETNMREVLLSLVPSCKIFEVPVGTKRGPVEVVMSAASSIKDDEEVIVSYCDYGTKWDYKKFLKDTRNSSSDGAIACYTGFHPHMLGSDHYAYVKNDGLKALQISEKKPFTDNKMAEFASNGTYYFKSGSILKKYFQKLIESGQTVKDEFYVSMVYNLLLEDGLNISIFEIEKMLQWGTPYDLEIYKSWSSYFDNLKKQKTKAQHPTGTTLVLPMAGRGSRFAEEGYELPKPLLEVDGSPMIVKAVECLPKTDNKVFICLKEHLQQYDLEKTLIESFNKTQVFSIEEVTQGQACTTEIGINIAKLDLEKPILISACDNGVFYDEEEYQKLIDDTSNDIIVWSFRNNQTSKINPNMYAWLKVDEKDFIKHVSCKKFIYENPLTTHAIIGTMFFRKARYFLDGLQKNYKENIRTNNEFYVDDVLNQNIKSGLNVKVFEVKNYICWGTPNDYKTYNYWKDYFNA